MINGTTWMGKGRHSWCTVNLVGKGSTHYLLINQLLLPQLLAEKGSWWQSGCPSRPSCVDAHWTSVEEEARQSKQTSDLHKTLLWTAPTGKSSCNGSIEACRLEIINYSQFTLPILVGTYTLTDHRRRPSLAEKQRNQQTVGHALDSRFWVRPPNRSELHSQETGHFLLVSRKHYIWAVLNAYYTADIHYVYTHVRVKTPPLSLTQHSNVNASLIKYDFPIVRYIWRNNSPEVKVKLPFSLVKLILFLYYVIIYCTHVQLGMNCHKRKQIMCSMSGAEPCYVDIINHEIYYLYVMYQYTY